MTHITPAQAREAATYLKERHQLSSDLSPIYVETLTTFIQQYEEMEAALKVAESVVLRRFAKSLETIDQRKADHNATVVENMKLKADIKTAISCLSGIREKAQPADFGIMFLHGSDVLEDISTALEYLRRAAAATKGE